VVFLTATEGEEILIDGHVRIRILAIHSDEVCFEINYPEYLRSENDTAYADKEKVCQWPAAPA
jgi:sRNA-binding carbon storage regulator CsrA